MLKYLALALAAVVLISIAVLAQNEVQDRGNDHLAYTRHYTSHSRDVESLGIVIPSRTNIPPVCERQIAGASFYHTTSSFFCYCRWDGALAEWRQMHAPTQSAGCGNP